MRRRLVHTAAKTGFSLESSQAYEKGRPTYSKESLELIMNYIFHDQKKSNWKVIEIGAGTGKFTESCIPFLVKNCTTSFSWDAIEPSDGFRESLKSKQLPQVQVMNGTGDSIPAGDKSYDAVMIAQAFHWMDSVATLKEIHRVLKPNGILCMIWNTYDYSKEWLRIVDQEILTPAYGDVPRQQNEKWRNCFQDNAMKLSFSPLHSWYQSYPFIGDKDMVLNRFLSTSVIVNLSPSEKLKVSDRILELLHSHPEFADARSTGKYTIPYVTHVAWTYSQPR